MREEIKISRRIIKFFQFVDSLNSICGYNEPLTYYQKNKPRIKEYQKDYKKRVRTPIYRGGILQPNKYYEKYRKSVKKNELESRLLVLYHYGGNPPRCACCGEREIQFLTMDHINNDGAEHRRKEGKKYHLIRWIIRNNFPEGFQVLCWNCNCAKGHYKICPHKKEKEKFENPISQKRIT